MAQLLVAERAARAIVPADAGAAAAVAVVAAVVPAAVKMPDSCRRAVTGARAAVLQSFLVDARRLGMVAAVQAQLPPCLL